MNKLSLTLSLCLFSNAGAAIEIIAPKELQTSTIQIADPDQHINTLGTVSFMVDLAAAHDDLLALKVRRSALTLKDGRKFSAFGVHKDAGVIVIAGGDVSHISIASVDSAAKGIRDASILFYSKDNKVISPRPKDVRVFNADFKPLDFSYTPLQAPGSLEISISIALDLSGSMAGHEGALASATKAFMLNLPEFTKCRVFSFSNDVYHLSPSDFSRLTSCPSSAFLMDRPLQAGGATALYKAIETGFTSKHALSDQAFPNIVVVITDGMNTVNYRQSIKRLTSQKHETNSKLFVFWAGNYQKNHLKGLADFEFISSQDLNTELNKFFNALGVSLSGLQVLHIGQ